LFLRILSAFPGGNRSRFDLEMLKKRLSGLCLGVQNYTPVSIQGINRVFPAVENEF